MECLGNVGGGVFINGTTFNTVTRSKYGRKAVANMTRDIAAARNFAVPPGTWFNLIYPTSLVLTVLS